MGIISVVFLVVIGLFLLQKKYINCYTFITCSFFLVCFQIIYIPKEYIWVVLISFLCSVLIYVISKKRATTLNYMYIFTILVLTLNFVTVKNEIYKNANTYININIINQVISPELQEEYINYISIGGYTREDVKKHIDNIAIELQKELDNLSIFEAYETYIGTKKYLEERQIYYATNQEAIIAKIEAEIAYYNTLNDTTKAEYQMEMKKVIEDVMY